MPVTSMTVVSTSAHHETRTPTSSPLNFDEASRTCFSFKNRRRSSYCSSLVLNRLQINRKSIPLYLVCITLFVIATALGQTPPEKKTLSWKTRLVSEREPGEPLIVSGTIYQSDGKTPIPNALLYVYHTDATGVYAPKGSAQDSIRIKGWMKTNSEGKFEFRTIKPVCYPRSSAVAHIHAKIFLPNGSERWDEFLFDGDTNLRSHVYEKHKDEGIFSPIMKINHGGDGVLRCVKNIRIR
ncbi:MAG: hypothetical protein EPO24_05290 [Bacteroidetes bacterium]|nr:MAG: hypothetical protein EPO24_05290 [Bacteroidota bacterium]